VEEFKLKLSSNKELTLLDIEGHVNEEEKTVLFNEVLLEPYKLIKDVFGNYVIQKMFEYGNL
jgi:hypothetical protein